MEERIRILWQGARPLIGTVVGVGIFGLPYVFSQAGFIVGTLELIFIASLTLLVFYVYSDLLSIEKSRLPFVSVIGNHLGPLGKLFAAVSFLGALWGALLAYILVGGEFLTNIFRPLIGGETFRYQIIFWMLASACMIGGSIFVRRVQSVLVPIFFAMVVGLTLIALPRLQTEYLLTFNPQFVGLPFGALLFSFSGLAAVSECREALGRSSDRMRLSLLLGTGLISALYLLFCFAVVGMTGPFTSMQSVEGLRLVAPWLSLFVSGLGVCTVFTAYISVGNSVMNSLMYDFRGRFLSSWWLTIIVPVGLLVFGARDFINVVGATGGFLGGLSGILLMIAYERARLLAQLPKYALRIPQPVVALGFILFAAMIIITIAQLM
jgi:tyrosine-specific transport protein